MPKLRDTILLAHASSLINAEEFVLLYDLHQLKSVAWEFSLFADDPFSKWSGLLPLWLEPLRTAIARLTILDRLVVSSPAFNGVLSILYFKSNHLLLHQDSKKEYWILLNWPWKFFECPFENKAWIIIRLKIIIIYIIKWQFDYQSVMPPCPFNISPQTFDEVSMCYIATQGKFINQFWRVTLAHMYRKLFSTREEPP